MSKKIEELKKELAKEVAELTELKEIQDLTDQLRDVRRKKKGSTGLGKATKDLGKGFVKAFDMVVPPLSEEEKQRLKDNPPKPLSEQFFNKETDIMGGGNIW